MNTEVERLKRENDHLRKELRTASEVAIRTKTDFLKERNRVRCYAKRWKEKQRELKAQIEQLTAQNKCLTEQLNRMTTPDKGPSENSVC